MKVTTCGHQPHYADGLCMTCYSRLYHESNDVWKKYKIYNDNYEKTMDKIKIPLKRKRKLDIRTEKQENNAKRILEEHTRKKSLGLCHYFYCEQPATHSGYCWVHFDKVERKYVCKIIYKATKALNDDKESIMKDVEFIKKYIGFTCPKLEPANSQTSG